MDANIAMYWMQEAMKTSLYILAPLLGAALVIGLLVSIFQAITSIQEMTLTYIPKMIVVGLLLLFLAPWMLQMLTDFMTAVISYIPNISR